MVCITIVLNKQHYVAPPAGGDINMSAAVGWVGVLGAVVAFGCYGILIKTPAVVAAEVNAMVFQVYYSVAVSSTLFLIWVCAASSEPVTFNGDSFAMGSLFAVLWILSQLFAYEAIKRLGYAV